jgi:hypothetical protein
MSEATVLETPPVPAPHPGAVTIDLGNLGKKPKAEPVVTDDAAAKAVAEKATTDNAIQSKATADAAKAAEAAKKPTDKEHNLAELRKAREAAEARAKEIEADRDRLKTEFETFKTKAPELPEDVKGKLSKFEELEKEREELRRTIRQTDLARDPEFQQKYNKPITDRITTMGQTALAAGVSEADWKNAVANWDEGQFAEWQEAMTPIQRVKFNAAWTAAVDLHQQQQTELKNADQTLQELQKQRQADAENQQKQYISQNEQLARSVIAETIKPETLKEYEDLGPAAEKLLMQAARHEIPAKVIFEQLAANQVLARVTVKQKSRIDELEAALAERDKKISDQDAFIANQAGAVPRGDAAGGSGATEKSGPIWNNIVVKAPG